MTAEQLTDRFVPKMKPLEDLRRAFMDATVERLAVNKTRASVKLAVASLATFALFLVLLVLMRRARSLVFEPLLIARHSIIELANDRPIARLQGKGGEGEMGRLFDAIDVLRKRLDERALLMRHLERQAETDELTGLLNRRALELIGGAEDAADSNQDACLILMDIDHFKQINDTHGHLVGDIVLKETARIIRNSVRNSDLVARFGGEEFAIITPGDSIESALALAERIRANLAHEPIVVAGGQELNVTASFGVAEGRTANGGWKHLIEDADTELYRAKSEGRNRVCGRPADLAPSQRRNPRARSQKVEHDPHAGRQSPARTVEHGVEGFGVAGVQVFGDRQQPAGLDILSDREGRQPGEAHARKREPAQTLAITHPHPFRRRQSDPFCIRKERPAIERPNVAVAQPVMRLDIPMV